MTFFKETTNPYEMEIKYKFVLYCMTWAAADEIEYNTIGAFQTSNSNTPVYYIVQWTGNAYTIQEIYTCHEFDPLFLIPEGDLICPANFMTPMIKTSYWYQKPYEAIPIMVNLKQVIMPFIEFIQDHNTTNKFPSRIKGYADMNPRLLSEHYH